MSRDTSKKKQNKPKGLEYALVADGETEQWYIQQFMQYYNVAIKITPELPKSKTLKTQYKLIESFIKEKTYTKILWIIDLDTILKENKNSKNPGKALSEFKTLYSNAITNWNNKVTIIINNPCLEYWYCMHKNPNMNTFFENYETLLPTLRKYNVDKQLFEKYNKSKKDDYQAGIGLYKKLLPYLAKMDFSKLKAFNIEKCETEGCSEMYKLFEFFQIDLKN